MERAYKGGAVSVLCATSTMAAGVNLPARRVIFRHAHLLISPLRPSKGCCQMNGSTAFRHMARSCTPPRPHPVQALLTPPYSNDVLWGLRHERMTLNLAAVHFGGTPWFLHNLLQADAVCREHYVGWDAPQNALDATRYRQMAGRAGRAGIDTHGEAILIAPRKPGVAKQLAELMEVRPPLLERPRAPVTFV